MENMYEELLAYLCIHCVLTGSAAPTDATIAELFAKYLPAECEYMETDSSSDLFVFWKNSQSAYDKLILAVLHSNIDCTSGQSHSHSYNGRRIGTCMQSIEWVPFPVILNDP